MSNTKYDVALSFASEDRPFVSQVANLFRANNVSVFYDAYETEALWGQDLTELLWRIYSIQSKHVIVFISEAYLKKIWTIHEFKSAMTKALKQKDDFLLPVQLDDTKLPGLPSSVSYLDARQYTPKDIFEFFVKKISKTKKGNNTLRIKNGLVIYRIAHKKFSIDLTGTGARLKGGRWNPAGMPALYTSSSKSHALLDILAYLESSDEALHLHMLEIRIPDSVKIFTLYESSLKKNWADDLDYTQWMGHEILGAKKYAVVSVPSALVEGERNYIINPHHPDAKKIKLLRNEPVHFDDRFFTRR